MLYHVAPQLKTFIWTLIVGVIPSVSPLLPGVQLMEWVAYVIRKAEVEINCVVRLLLFANIKHSLAVSDARTRPVRLKVKVAVFSVVSVWSVFVDGFLHH